MFGGVFPHRNFAEDLDFEVTGEGPFGGVEQSYPGGSKDPFFFAKLNEQ